VWGFGFQLKETDEFPDMILINLIDVDGIETGIEELQEFLKETGVPFDGLGALTFRLAGEFETLDEIS